MRKQQQARKEVSAALALLLSERAWWTYAAIDTVRLPLRFAERQTDKFIVEAKAKADSFTETTREQAKVKYVGVNIVLRTAEKVEFDGKAKPDEVIGGLFGYVGKSTEVLHIESIPRDETRYMSEDEALVLFPKLQKI